MPAQTPDTQIAIFTETTPLWPYCPQELDEPWLISVTLNIGWLGEYAPTGYQTDSLFPWKWEINKFRLFLWKESYGASKIVEQLSDVQLTGDFPDDVTIKRADGDNLKRRIEKWFGAPDSKDWEPWRIRCDELRADMDDPKRSAQGLLAQIAQYPVPLGSVGGTAGGGLNLSAVIKVPIDKSYLIDKGHLIAVPVFSNGADFDTGDKVLFEFDKECDLLYCTYEPVGIPENPPWLLYGSGVGLAARPEQSAVLYDTEDYFVRKSCQTKGGLSGDPVVAIRSALPQLFDFPQFILSQARKKFLGDNPPLSFVTEDRESDDDEVRATDFRSLMFAAIWHSIRPVPLQELNTWPGDESPDDWHKRWTKDVLGSSLAKRLLRIAQETNDDQANKFGTTLLRWQCRIGRKAFNLDNRLLKKLEKTVLSDDEISAIDVGGAARAETWIDAWQNLISSLRNDEALRELILLQWREALAFANVLAREHEMWGAYAKDARELYEQISGSLERKILPGMRLVDAIAADTTREFLRDVLPSRESAQMLMDEAVSTTLSEEAVKGAKRAIRKHLDDLDPELIARLTSDDDIGEHANAVIGKVLDPLVGEDGAEPGHGGTANSNDTNIEIGPGDPTQRPHPITIQLAPAHREEDALDGAAEVSADIAGYGVLMRRSKTNRISRKTADHKIIAEDWKCWRLLTMAVPHVMNGVGTPLKTEGGSTLELPVPIALGYEGGARQAFVTYDERSLTARYREEEVSVEDVSDADDGPVDHVLDFFYTELGHGEPENPRAEHWRDLPPLAFGAYYQLAAFAMGPGGVLPPELSEGSGHPGVLRKHPKESLITGEVFTVPKESIHKVRYLRRVPVGLPRLPADGTDDGYKRSAKAAKNVVTIAGSLERSHWMEQAASPDSTAILMLSEETRLFDIPAKISFEVKPPLTDPLTFARWRRLDQFIEENGEIGPPDDEVMHWNEFVTRILAAAHHISELEDERYLGKVGGRPGLEIEDPAVTCIIAELVPLRGQRQGEMKRSKELIRVPKRIGNPDEFPDDIDKLRCVLEATHTTQKIRIEIETEADPAILEQSALMEVGESTTEFRIKIKATEIWELRLYAAVRESLFDHDGEGVDCRFHPKLTVEKRAVTIDDEELKLFAPQCYLIEGISAGLPGEQELYASMRPVLAGDRVSVLMDRVTGPAGGPEPFDPKIFSRWDNVGEMRIESQDFIWSGRSIPPFPFSAAANGGLDMFPDATDDPTANAMAWDAVGFENQQGDPPGYQDAAIPVGASGTPIEISAVGGRKGALYYRFRGQATHRYDALRKEGTPALTGVTKRLDHDRSTPWKRFLVPARPNRPLSPPAVTFLVPLTESDQNGSCRMPPLLAHIEENATAVGGLAEITEVRIGQVTEEKDGDSSTTPTERKVDQKSVWMQLAPDPIRHDCEYQGNKRYVSLEVSALLGQTFDTGARTPKITGTSALIPAPEGLDADKSYMTILRLRRVLHPLGVIGGLTQIVEPDSPTDARTRTWSAELVSDLVLAVQLNSLEDGAFLAFRSISGQTGAATVAAGEKPDDDIAVLEKLVVHQDDIDDQFRQFRLEPTGYQAEKSLRTTEHCFRWRAARPGGALPNPCRLYLCFHRAGMDLAKHGDNGGERDGNPKTVWDAGLYSDDGRGGWRQLGAGILRLPPNAKIEICIEDGEGTGGPPTVESAPFHASDWSAPYQSQWQAADLAEIDGVGSDPSNELCVKSLDAGSIQIVLAADASPIPLEGRTKLSGKWSSDRHGLYYRVLLTKQVYDASGILSGEVAVGLFEDNTPNGDSKILRMIWPNSRTETESDMFNESEKERLRARIMLWQEAPRTTGGDGSVKEQLDIKEQPDIGWNLLFPQLVSGKPPDEAPARIIRIMPPIRHLGVRDHGD